MRSSGETADAEAIASSHGRHVRAFLLHATVKSAKAALDLSAAGCKIAFEWFAVTVTAAKWGILAHVLIRAGGGGRLLASGGSSAGKGGGDMRTARDGRQAHSAGPVGIVEIMK